MWLLNTTKELAILKVDPGGYVAVIGLFINGIFLSWYKMLKLCPRYLPANKLGS